MNVKVDFDNIVVKEDKNDFNVKVLMLKGEKGDGAGATKTSELQNDSGFITNTVDDLTNYYKKTETYSKTETNNLLNNKADVSELNNYYETSEIDDFLNSKADASDLDNYYTKIQTYNQSEVNSLLNQKADTTSIDTINSTLNTKANASDVANTYETKSSHNADITSLSSQISGLASGSPLVASSTVGMTDTTKVYVNTSDGYWYYYDGTQWQQGGVYQASYDTDDISTLKYTDAMISEDTLNLFDMAKLLNAVGWELDENGVARGTMSSLKTAYGNDESDFITFNGVDTKFYFRCLLRNTGETTSDTRGFTVVASYTDGTTSGGNVKNTATSWTELVVTSKTVDTAPLKSFYFTYSSGSANVWEIKDAILVTGSRNAVDYFAHKTAKDLKARNDILSINTDIENIEIDIADLKRSYTIDGSYGVKINTDGTVQRYGDAVGLNNNYIVGDNMAYDRVNDFDNVFPWSDMKLCNIYTDNNGDEQICYENNANFSRTGSNGNVLVEIPKFYTKRYKNNNGDDIILISGTKKSGYVLEPAFTNSITGEELEKIYVGAYLSSDDGIALNSKTGSFPLARKNKNYINSLSGDMYDFVTLQALQKLIMIEFAEINMSPILGGLSDMVWSSCKAYETISNTNTAIFGGASYINNLRVGSTIGVNDSFGVIENRTITNIEEIATNQRRITFDGEPVNVTNEVTYLYSTGQKSGDTDVLDYHTGRTNYINNNSMANQFKYRNIEGLWGNLGEIMDGVIVKGLRLYWDNIKDNYDDVTKMKKLNYAVPLQNTYSSSANPLPSQIKEMGLDFRNPAILAPKVLDEWDDTYYGDAFFSIYDETPEGQSVSPDTEYIGISSMAWDGKAQNGLFTLRFWATKTQHSNLYGTRMIKRN